MSSVTEAAKYLQIKPARQANAQEMQWAQGASGSSNLDKYATIDAARTFQTVPVVITLPAYQQSYGVIPFYPNRLLFQYNVVAPSPFYLFDGAREVAPGPSYKNYFYITVKWRIGDVVHRYFVYGFKGTFAQLISSPENYSGQLIGANCCFEVWSVLSFDSVQPPELIGLSDNLNLKTSLLRIPSDANGSNVYVGVSKTYDVVGNGFTFPLAQGFTINQPDVAFVSN